MNSPLHQRIDGALEERKRSGRLRRLIVRPSSPGTLNLADNDTLDLARDSAVVAAAREATLRYGCSSSASPLITGYTEAHRELERRLCQWHGAPNGLIWNSGFTANQAVLGHLPAREDLVLADRLIHNSMISGILRSGARLRRYRHNDTDHLESLLKESRVSGRAVFVVTESVFSMDGDYPDLSAMAALKKRFGFIWIVDEAHAIGWFGSSGAGMLEETGVAPAVDVIVGTLGKALGSQGAYTLFRSERLRDYLINLANEFIYSTYLAPSCAAAATAAIERCRALAAENGRWRAASSAFRRNLREDGRKVPDGDSPIVPVTLGEERRTLDLASTLAGEGILVGAVRPPTVPAATSRLRLSLKRRLSETDYERVRSVLSRTSRIENDPDQETGK